MIGCARRVRSIWTQVRLAAAFRRLCSIFADDEIEGTIPTWRGCAAELAAVADDRRMIAFVRVSKGNLPVAISDAPVAPAGRNTPLR
jgi:hypothetical protein